MLLNWMNKRVMLAMEKYFKRIENYLLYLLIVMQTSCSVFHLNSGTNYNDKGVKKINFCDLQENNSLIETNLIYTGFEEYWYANGLKNCKINTNVNLNFSEFYNNDNEYCLDKKLRKLNKNYTTKKAIITVIGIFKNDSITNEGYGHLNSSSSEIKVLKVKRIKLINKNSSQQ